MKVVQEMIGYFDRRGKLSRRQLKKLLEDSYVATDAPSSMHGLCDVTGATYYFRITGTTEGQIWGTDIYTRDSTLGAAAVHMGLLQPGESAVLRVTVVEPPKHFPGTARNGVTTSDYGEFPHAWKLTVI